MKRIKISCATLIVFIYLIVGAQNTCLGLDFGVAEPVPGFQLGHDIAFNYVTPDAKFMLLQVWDPVWRIKSSTWDENLKQWSSPQELPTDPSGGFPGWTGSSSLSPDGLTMFYGGGRGPGTPWVCRSTKTPNGWTLSAEIVPNLDGLAASTYFNGTFFYGTVLYVDIWFSKYDPATGQFSPAVPVDSINTSGSAESGAWISRDNTLLVFSSDRPGGYGGYDLYSATWDQNLQKWVNITNLGPNVNTHLDEYSPNIAEEAGLLFFDRYNPSTNLRQLMQASVRFEVAVTVDIKPGSYPNAINLGSQGLIPVAILSDEKFDATTVDPDTVELAGADIAVRGKGNKFLAHEEDVNEDGLVDLIVQVATANLDPDSFQDGWAILTGSTYDGQAIEGWDEITIVPPEQ